MNRPALLLLLLFFAGLMGCQSDERPTPTPFPTPLPQAALPGAPQLAQGIPTTLADLLDNPEFFSGALVQVSGQFGQLPRLVCGQLTPHPSPATWTLQDGDALIQAGGFAGPLRELFPDDLTLTVVGRWQQWRGPVGCGKQAVVREFYYLEVTRLLSPNQLVRATLTPGGLLPAAPEPPEQETPTAVSPFPDQPEPPEGTAVTSPSPTTPSTPGEVVATPAPGSTPTRSEAGEEDDDDNGALPGQTPPGQTPPGQTTPGSTPSPAGTPGGNGNEPAPPGIPGQATPTPGGQTVERGQLAEFDARYDAWAAGEIHNWRISLRPGKPITVSLIAEPEINTAIRLLSSAGQVLDTQDSAPAGQVESLEINVSTAGDYVIQVYATDNRAGRYYFSLWDDFGAMRPMGNLSPNAFRSAQLGDFAIHVWFFRAEAGRLITLETATPASYELILTLLDTNQNLLTFEIDTIRNFQIPVTGWYSVELEETLGEVTDYQITLTIQ